MPLQVYVSLNQSQPRTKRKDEAQSKQGYPKEDQVLQVSKRSRSIEVRENVLYNLHAPRLKSMREEISGSFILLVVEVVF